MSIKKIVSLNNNKTSKKGPLETIKAFYALLLVLSDNYSKLCKENASMASKKKRFSKEVIEAGNEKIAQIHEVLPKIFRFWGDFIVSVTIAQKIKPELQINVQEVANLAITIKEIRQRFSNDNSREKGLASDLSLQALNERLPLVIEEIKKIAELKELKENPFLKFIREVKKHINEEGARSGVLSILLLLLPRVFKSVKEIVNGKNGLKEILKNFMPTLNKTENMNIEYNNLEVKYPEIDLGEIPVLIAKKSAGKPEAVLLYFPGNEESVLSVISHLPLYVEELNMETHAAGRLGEEFKIRSSKNDCNAVPSEEAQYLACLKAFNNAYASAQKLGVPFIIHMRSIGTAMLLVMALNQEKIDGIIFERGMVSPLDVKGMDKFVKRLLKKAAIFFVKKQFPKASKKVLELAKKLRIEASGFNNRWVITLFKKLNMLIVQGRGGTKKVKGKVKKKEDSLMSADTYKVFCSLNNNKDVKFIKVNSPVDHNESFYSMTCSVERAFDEAINYCEMILQLPDLRNIKSVVSQIYVTVATYSQSEEWKLFSDIQTGELDISSMNAEALKALFLKEIENIQKLKKQHKPANCTCKDRGLVEVKEKVVEFIKGCQTPSLS
ncbi:hypothetical protein ACFLZV_02240 [Candidatus Margulisiibacteriota bacterium]